jgi:hypothetical protein
MLERARTAIAGSAENGGWAWGLLMSKVPVDRNAGAFCSEANHDAYSIERSDLTVVFFPDGIRDDSDARRVAK